MTRPSLITFSDVIVLVAIPGWRRPSSRIAVPSRMRFVVAA
jgi:hypothetical protein